MKSIYCLILQELRILKTDPAPFVVLFIMPTLAMLLFSPALGAVLREQGMEQAHGAMLAIPGMSVMFGSMGAAFLGFAIFREHQWQTWQRLLVSPAPIQCILIAKVAVPFALIFIQQILLLSIACVIYKLPLPDSLFAYVLVSSGFALNVTAIGILAAAFCKSLQQMNAIIHGGALVVSACSGAFIPLSQLPSWIQSISVITPGFWLVKSHTGILLNQFTLFQCIDAFIIMVAQAILFIAISAHRFQTMERKQSWA